MIWDLLSRTQRPLLAAWLTIGLVVTYVLLVLQIVRTGHA